MHRRRLLRALAPVTGAVAGCTAIEPGATTTPAPTPHEPAYDAHTFDHADLGGAVVEGGIAYPEAFDTRRYVALLTTAADRDRIRLDLVRRADPTAAEFVAETQFDAGYLVVYQEFPLSSEPDYRVTEVVRDGAAVRVAIDNSSEYGTDDITVETVLVRVAREGLAPPERAVVTTEEGVSAST
ncbi:MAG: hypothetical protein ABEH77_05700 [Halobacteriaceae archaeon]